VNAKEPTHLVHRDRLALAFRIVGTAVGFVALVMAFTATSLTSVAIGFLVLTICGGAVSYHLLTSMVRCPACANRVSNLGIASADAQRKIFLCPHCGTTAWLREGFYWQREVSG
jgi:hypothetical protein